MSPLPLWCNNESPRRKTRERDQRRAALHMKISLLIKGITAVFKCELLTMSRKSWVSLLFIKIKMQQEIVPVRCIFNSRSISGTLTYFYIRFYRGTGRKSSIKCPDQHLCSYIKAPSEKFRNMYRLQCTSESI